MLIFILLPFLIAIIKKMRFKSIFLKPDLYPVLFAEAVHIFFQINFFFGKTDYVKYSKYLQIFFMVSLLLPVIRKKLYLQAIVGSVFAVIGSVLNKIVINVNGGHMPVYPTLSKLTGFYHEGQLSGNIDSLHIFMTNATKLNFLADYIDLGFSILSPGDVLIHMFIAVIIYYTLKTESLLKT